MIEFTRVPVPISRSENADMRELLDALLKTAVDHEAIALRTLPINEHSFRANVSRWARVRGYRAHIYKQGDGSWVLWLTARTEDVQHG
jgi:hypothetical protein